MRRWMAAVAIVAGVATTPAAALAQDGKGFLFRPPSASLTLRAGMADVSARGDLFDLVTNTLTLERSDFTGLSASGELAFGRPGSRLDVVLGGGYMSADAGSDYREVTGSDGLPIVQTSSLKRVPVTLGLKAYLLPRGRMIGSLAWVPSRVAPYVGVGAGALWYRFKQYGEFVDFTTPDSAIFEDVYQSSGWGPAGYAGGGIDVTLSPRVALAVDARYMYAQAGVNGSFTGFDRVDLSGLSTTVGITFRY